MRKYALYIPIFLIIVGLVGCNLPMSVVTTLPPGAAYTQAAQTVEAELTRIAAGQGLPSATSVVSPVASVTLPATIPPLPVTATSTTIPCNVATFVGDVNIPDGTTMSAGQAFTKTWRIKNVGSCTWTSGYQLVFVQGDAMGGPVSKTLTTGTVGPGQTVDVSVDLVAPASAGTYKGYWKFRDSGSVLFGTTTGSSIWVEIKVVTGTTHTVNLTRISAESGSVRSDNTVLSGVPNVGDTNADVASQAFVSFDISGIPSNATVTYIEMDFSDYDMLGDPFGSLGCLFMYKQNFGTLDAGDFFTGVPANPLYKWCTAAILSSLRSDDEVADAVQSRIGQSRVQFRFQFKDTDTDSDGVADMVRLGDIVLHITYHVP